MVNDKKPYGLRREKKNKKGKALFSLEKQGFQFPAQEQLHTWKDRKSLESRHTGQAEGVL